MANYDDIFNASAQKGTEDKSFVSFNKEEWAAQKKQERESAFAMIDETAQRMANDGSLFQSYLDVQARFDRYSVGNAVLITAQKADATQLSDFKGWKNNGVFIKKGESGIVLLEPGEEYTKEDGTVGVSYNSKKVFDISQTTAKAKDRPAMKRDERLLLKAIIHNAPCPIEISQKLPENINAVYRPDDKKIYVRPGLEAGDIFRGISQELAHAHLDSGAYKRSDHAFTAYCVSYVLCSRYNVPKDMNDGSMFADLCKYTDADFYKEHPTIAFDTLSGLGKYEVVAAFKFNTNRETFKYNEYTLMDEVQFAEFMENVRARQLYDTGVTAEYGDQLLTLSTCEYTYPNGRFVVVAKKA